MDLNMKDFLEDVFLPLGIVFMIFGLPMLAFVYFRILAHRERMATLGLGIVPQPVTPGAAQPAPESAGLGEPAQVTLNKGIRLALIGFALTLGITIASFHFGDGGTYWHPGPWLLIGFVPMFIGIAQIVIARISGATLTPKQPPPRGEAPIAYASDFDVPEHPPI